MPRPKPPEPYITISVRVPKSLLAQLDEEAQQRLVSRSEWCVTAIERVLKNESEQAK